MTELVTINTDNYATMAKAMGIATGNSSTVKKANNLNRLRIWHSPVMGKAEVNGKTKNGEELQYGKKKGTLVPKKGTFAPNPEKINIRRMTKKGPEKLKVNIPEERITKSPRVNNPNI